MPPDSKDFHRSPDPDSGPAAAVELLRGDRKSAVMDASLVLSSQGVRHRIDVDAAGFRLVVDAADAGRARAALEHYVRENTGYRVEKPAAGAFPLHLSPALHLAIPALVSFWAAAVPWGDWLEGRGAAAAARILNGEWWRALTATTLHADAEHFLGNMLSGYFIFNLLRRRCGPGTSMLLLTLAALLANVAVAALSPPHYYSRGFSTVVFAGLGLLAAVETRHFPRGLRPGLRDLTPLLGAFFLAVMTGLGENADVKAHFIGFAFGAAMAPASFWLARRGFEARSWQTAAVLGVYAIYAVAWRLAWG